jgi:hypothetical protein
MKTVPIDLQHLIAVVIAVLLPFLPVLLFEVPLNVILPDLVKLTTLGMERLKAKSSAIAGHA